MNARKILAQNLKTIRKSKRLSIEKMSECYDISPRELSDLENEKTNVKIDTLESVSQSLNIDTADLLSRNFQVQVIGKK